MSAMPPLAVNVAYPVVSQSPGDNARLRIEVNVVFGTFTDDPVELERNSPT
jgi:hypothetical protein